MHKYLCTWVKRISQLYQIFIAAFIIDSHISEVDKTNNPKQENTIKMEKAIKNYVLPASLTHYTVFN